MFNDARLTNFIANTLALLAVLAMIASVIVWVAQRPYFTITQVQIEPIQGDDLSYVSAATVRATIAGRLKGNFFNDDPVRTKDSRC